MNEITIPSLSLWDLCLEGGWTMIPMALLLLLSIYVFVERLIVINVPVRRTRTS
ncbi:MAG: hypothetical protein K2J38_02440 [Muribaculaceae bacterium]|nr:hypothetical protein [Muribaculaceae bacterium]